MMLGLRRSLLFCTLIMIATTSFERAFGQDAGSPTEQQPPAAAPPSDSSARRCADGTICPRVALGAIVDTSGNCVAWVYRTEKCTGFFAVADLACGTQPGSCASDPCNCARNLIGVPKVSVTTTGGADPVGATTAEPTRYFSPAIKSSVSKAVQFYSNSLSTKESTKYAKAMTATGEILIRLETYKHTASGDVWGMGFKETSVKPADAEIEAFQSIDSSTSFAVKIRNSENALHLPSSCSDHCERRTVTKSLALVRGFFGRKPRRPSFSL